MLWFSRAKVFDSLSGGGESGTSLSLPYRSDPFACVMKQLTDTGKREGNTTPSPRNIFICTIKGYT